MAERCFFGEIVAMYVSGTVKATHVMVGHIGRSKQSGQSECAVLVLCPS